MKRPTNADKNSQISNLSKMNLSVNMITSIVLLNIRLSIFYFYKYRNIELWAAYLPVHISIFPNCSSTVNVFYDENI